MEAFQDAAVERQFTARERRDAPAGPNSAQYYAGRFAAKEAVLKALGVGFAQGVAFTDVEIVQRPNGAPTVELSGHAATIAASLGIGGWWLSISHTKDVAVGSAIAVDSGSSKGEQ